MKNITNQHRRGLFIYEKYNQLVSRIQISSQSENEKKKQFNGFPSRETMVLCVHKMADQFSSIDKQTNKKPLETLYY